MQVAVSSQTSSVAAVNPGERVWAMLPVAPLLHAGEKFLAFTTEAVYVFGSPPAADPAHPGKCAYFFEDEFSSPPLAETEACFRKTAQIRLADVKRYALESEGFSRILVIETSGSVKRFPLGRGSGAVAKKIMKVLNGPSLESGAKWLRPAGITLLFLGLLLSVSPAVSLYVSLPAICAGGILLALNGE